VFLSEIICYLANLSFSQGVFPQSYKSAFITPLLKKTWFKLQLSLQLPTTNLNNISKIPECFCAHYNHMSPLAPNLTPSNLLTTPLVQTLNHAQSINQ